MSPPPPPPDLAAARLPALVPTGEEPVLGTRPR